MINIQSTLTSSVINAKRATILVIGSILMVGGLVLSAPVHAVADDGSYVLLRSTQPLSKIAPSPSRSLASATVSVDDQICSGSPLTPAPKVTLNGRTLVQFVDYRCSYENNGAPGIANVTVIGIGSYSGSQSATFEIKGSASLMDASIVVESQVYTGSQLTPAPKVTYAHDELVAGKDYDVSYVNNVNAGTAALTISGKGGFIRSKTVLFRIDKADIASAEIGAMAAMPYTGRAVTPTPSVKFGSAKLEDGVDYALSYKGNVKSGDAVVTVSGQGNFTGAQDTRFKIAKESLKRATVEPMETELAYAGEEKKPVPKVTCAGKRLQANIDYTLSYKSNSQPGTATVVIKGVGDYTGVAIAKFEIANLGDNLARKACELSYSQQRWAKNGFKGTKAYLAAFAEYKNNSIIGGRTPVSCSVGMHIAMRASGYDGSFKVSSLQDCKYLNFWSKTPGNDKWTCIGDYSQGMELLPGDIMVGDWHEGVHHIFMYVGSEIAQEVYETNLKGTDADCGEPVGEWVASHQTYHGGAALCICQLKTACSSTKHYKVFRCTSPDFM